MKKKKKERVKNVENVKKKRSENENLDERFVNPQNVDNVFLFLILALLSDYPHSVLTHSEEKRNGALTQRKR